MDSVVFDNVKAEKASAMRRFNLVRNFWKLFRFVELCLALVFLSWSLTPLSFAVRNSGEYFSQLVVFISSPLFGFIVCNAIIAVLMANRGRFSGHLVGHVDGAESEMHDELTQNIGDLPKSLSENDSLCSGHDQKEIVYQDKEIVCEANSKTDGAEILLQENPKMYRRTQSEKFKRECSEKPSEKLRRSETEKFRNVERFGENSDDERLYYDEEDLSNDEFQEKIEAFIAKQLRFRREESRAIVLHSQT